MLAQERFCKRTAPTLEVKAWAARVTETGERLGVAKPNPTPTEKNPFDGPQPGQTVHLYLDNLHQDHHLLRVWMTPDEAIKLASQLMRMAEIKEIKNG